jgi:SMODS-associating 2TM, beta-strand rich effector domain
MHAYAGGSRARMLGILATISVAIAIVLNVLWQTIHFEYDWLVSAPTVAGVFAILYEFVDARAWKWGWLHTIGLIDTPVVDGTYKGTLKSTWEKTTVPVEIRIDQRWTRMRVRFEVTEPRSSTSVSIASFLALDGHTDARLTYTYKNEIRPSTADEDMRDHDGTADLLVDKYGKAGGRYFNARGRQGDLELVRA